VLQHAQDISVFTPLPHYITDPPITAQALESAANDRSEFQKLALGALYKPVPKPRKPQNRLLNPYPSHA